MLNYTGILELMPRNLDDKWKPIKIAVWEVAKNNEEEICHKILIRAGFLRQINKKVEVN
jgi:hypothetical protein